MAAFTVHVPGADVDGAVAADKIVFLRDGFSWAAFVFGPLWLAWRRAWLVALLWALTLVVVAFGGEKLGLSHDFATLIGLALAVLLGFEGSRLVAWTLARKGYRECAVVLGDDLEEAETAYFNQLRRDTIARGPQGSSATAGAAQRNGEAPSP